MNGPLERILREAGDGSLPEVLRERLSPTDLQSLMLEVYRARAEAVNPARLLRRFEDDRFVRPTRSDPRLTLEFDRVAFDLCVGFEAIELSPVAPLGVCSAIATVAQDKVVSTSRNTEVVSDATNVLALESAVRRRRSPSEWARLCASHRVIRAQDFGVPGMAAHFRLFSMTTAGRDTGSFRFERAALEEQLAGHLAILEAHRAKGAKIVETKLALTLLDSNFAAALEEVVDSLRAKHPYAQIGYDPERQAGRGYYQTVCFKIFVVDDTGAKLEVGDGGFTDWTQSLLGNRKERFLISAISNERVVGLLPQ